MNNPSGEIAKFPVTLDEPDDGVCCVWVAADVQRLVVVTANQCVVTHLSYNELDREVLLQNPAVADVSRCRHQ